MNLTDARIIAGCALPKHDSRNCRVCKGVSVATTEPSWKRVLLTIVIGLTVSALAFEVTLHPAVALIALGFFDKFADKFGLLILATWLLYVAKRFLTAKWKELLDTIRASKGETR